MEGNESPEAINRRELMEYYGYTGRIGSMKLFFYFVKNRILDSFAYYSPAPGLTILFNRLKGVKIGQHVYIGPRVQLDFLYPKRILIEDYVSIGMGSMIFAHSNPTCSLHIKRNYYPRKVASTTIRRGAWIAPGNIILAGVTIGENSVTGAGSVVSKNVEPYTVVAGNPAKIVKKLDPIKDEY